MSIMPHGWNSIFTTHDRMRAVVLGLSSAALLAGCSTMAPDSAAPAIVAQQPETFGANAAAGEYRPAAWWQSYEDPVLNALVEEALRENLDLVEAAARLARANAQARIARSALLPSLNGTVSGSYSDSPLAGSGFGSLGSAAVPGDDPAAEPVDAGPDRLTVENYGVSFGASYELDLFGRNRSELAAARANAAAAAQDYRTLQLAAASEAISSYFEIVDARRQVQLTLSTADVLRDRVDRTEDRFQRGLAESFEVYQLRQDLRSTQSALPTREIALENAANRLALVLADYPAETRGKIDRSLRPRLDFSPVPTGLPIELLAQRPDIAAAWNRLEAARLRIGARRAERFPILSLSGSLGTQAGDPAGAFDFVNNWLASLATSAVAPLFDGGRTSANIRAARATYDEQAAAYGRTVLSAHGEVVTALEEYEEQRQRYRILAAQEREAQSALSLQATRFRRGVGTYTAFLDAQRALYQVESAISGAARDVALARLGVHRALGGDWTTEDIAPDIIDGEIP